MRNNTVEIIYTKGQKLRLHISVTSTLGKIQNALGGNSESFEIGLTGWNKTVWTFKKQDPGKWKVLDFGLIKFHAGIVLSADEVKDLTTRTIYLVNIEKTWGIKLFNYYDIFGVNDAGEGTVPITWVTGLAQGRFTWSIID